MIPADIATYFVQATLALCCLPWTDSLRTILALLRASARPSQPDIRCMGLKELSWRTYTPCSDGACERRDTCSSEPATYSVVCTQVVHLLVPTGGPEVLTDELDCVQGVREKLAVVT